MLAEKNFATDKLEQAYKDYETLKTEHEACVEQMSKSVEEIETYKEKLNLLEDELVASRLRERRDSGESIAQNSGWATGAEEELLSETVSASAQLSGEEPEAPSEGAATSVAPTRDLRKVSKRALEEELNTRQQAKLRKKERAKENRRQGLHDRAAAAASAASTDTRTPMPLPKRGGIRGFFCH